MKLIQTSTGKELTTAKKKGNNLRFTFGKFTAEHAGQYKCEVSSSNGQASSTAYISMRGMHYLLNIVYNLIQLN